MTSDYVSYRNGNYKVFLNLNDGTKIRLLDEGEERFNPEFPEGCDIMISNRCNRGCPYCYAGCTPDGEQPPIPKLDFMPYTEVAINLNFPLHPELNDFLWYQRDRNVIVNATVNQDDAMLHRNKIQELQFMGLIKAIGISYTRRDDKNLPSLLSDGPNRIVHVIEGLFSKEDHEYLKQFHPKILILGYKMKARGMDYAKDNLDEVIENRKWLGDNLEGILRSYDVVSFDNVALEVLGVEDFLGPGEYEKHFMGDEGEFTFAIDLVKGGYAVSSQEPPESYKPMGDLTPTEMFNEVRRSHGLV